MNLFELQERLKDFSQDQLVREMQAPTGMAPQYLVLSELQRRQRMMREQQAQMPEDQTTVAQDAVAAAGVPQGGLADMAQALAPRTDMDMNTGVEPVERMRDGGVVRMQPGGLAGISRDLDAYSPTMTGGDARRRMMEEEDARRRRAELAAAMFQYSSGPMPVQTGEDQLFDPYSSPLLPQDISPEEGAPPVGTDLRGLGTVVGEFISGEDPEAAATRLLESGQIDEEQYNRYVFGSSREREQVVREALDLAPRREFPVPADVTDEAAATAATRARETAASFEEEALGADREAAALNLQEMLPIASTFEEEATAADAEIAALPEGRAPTLPLPDQDEDEDVRSVVGGATAPAMDDSFEQDKWLALAQFGLNLMSSQQPTFGGALGEAGLAGITALRTARSERDKRIEAQQARADRLAAAAARGERGDISSTERAAYFRAANEAEAEVARLELAIARGGEVGEGGFVMNPYTPEELAILERQLNAAKSRASVYSGLSNPALATIQAAL